jgi:hypothetical protein
MYFKEIGLHAQNMLIILGSIINIFGGETYMIFEELKNLHFEDEEDIHMSSKNYVENGYRNIALDLLIISHEKWVQRDRGDLSL